MRVNKKIKVCIIGAGFGGITTLFNLKNYFKDNKNIDITLISDNDSFIFYPLLHEVATGEVSPENVQYPLKDIENQLENFSFIKDKVIDINFENKEVLCSSNKVKYDYLVLSVGVVNNYFGNESIRQNTLSLKNVKQAVIIRESLSEALNNIDKGDEYRNFVVVGAGATGVEVIGGMVYFIKEQLEKLNKTSENINIYLIEASDKVLQEFQDERYSQMAVDRLKDLGVKLLINHEVRDYDGLNISVFNKDKSESLNIKSKTVIWSAGFKANPLNETLKISKDEKNKIIVDEYLSLPDYPEVYVIGDNASVINQALYTTAQVAVQQADIVSHNIYAKTRLFRYSKKFKYFHQGTLVTIGRNYGISDLFGLKITGYSGWFVWKLLHIAKMYGVSKRGKVFVDWLKTLTIKRYGIE